MSDPSSACQFFTGPLGTHFPYVNKQIGSSVPRIESTLCKKPRMSENANPLGTANAMMTSNFKTQVCRKFMRGHCSYGSKCLFAHGNDDLRKPSRNAQKLLLNSDTLGNSSYGVFRMVDRLRLCRMFYFQKECTYGDKCRFLHVDRGNDKQDLGLHRETSAISIDAGEGFVASKPEFRKRKLCNNWEITGGCYYGKMCNFAHGQAELEKSGAHFATVSEKRKTLPTGKHGIGSNYSQQVEGMKSIFKWKAVKKLCGIYADWIEDTPLLQSSLNKLESQL